MPETNAIFSRGMPSVGMIFCTVARIAKSPQPGHQRTIWSDLKSLAVCTIGPAAGRISISSGMLFVPLEDRVDAGFDLGDLEGLALDLVESRRGDQVFRADDLE